MDETAERLVEFAAGVRLDTLPARTLHAVRRCLVDSVGCAVAAVHEPHIVELRRLAARYGGDDAGLVGSSVRTTPDLAAFVNGAMIRCRDFNDDYFGGSGDLGPHPSDNIGGVLAAAESVGAGGRAVVEGVTIAYEVVCQLVDQVRPQGRARTWDYTVFHAAATALAAGRIFGLRRDQLHDALGLAVVSNLSLYQTRSGELSAWKGLAGPYASRAGLFAAMLARAGITGPREPFAGRAGLSAHLDNQFSVGPFGDEDHPYKVESICIKSLPIRYTNQMPTMIALELHRDLADAIAEGAVQSVVVFGLARDAVTREAFPHQWAPSTRETADHSLPYLVAVALIDGEITERTFTPERFRDPAVLALMSRIEFRADPRYTAMFPQNLAGRIEVTVAGRVISLERTNPLGHPANPMTDEQLEAKFLRQTADVLSPQAARALLDRLWAMETEASVTSLLAATRSSMPSPLRTGP